MSNSSERVPADGGNIPPEFNFNNIPELRFGTPEGQPISTLTTEEEDLRGQPVGSEYGNLYGEEGLQSFKRQLGDNERRLKKLLAAQKAGGRMGGDGNMMALSGGMGSMGKGGMGGLGLGGGGIGIGAQGMTGLGMGGQEMGRGEMGGGGMGGLGMSRFGMSGGGMGGQGFGGYGMGGGGMGGQGFGGYGIGGGGMGGLGMGGGGGKMPGNLESLPPEYAGLANMNEADRNAALEALLGPGAQMAAQVSPGGQGQRMPFLQQNQSHSAPSMMGDQGGMGRGQSMQRSQGSISVEGSGPRFSHSQFPRTHNVGSQEFTQQIINQVTVEANQCTDAIAQGMNTILVLDTSSSMDGNPIWDAKNIIEGFISGLEDNAMDHGIEENVALIVFGRQTKVVQHFTNDYTKIRDAADAIICGGESSIMEALVMTVGMLERGGPVTLMGNHVVNARIVIISDGELTMTGAPDGDDKPQTGTEYMIKEQVVGLAQQISEKSGMKISFVPVGETQCEALLSVVQITGGEVTVDANWLSRNYLHHTVASYILGECRGKPVEKGVAEVLIKEKYKDLSELDMNAVLVILDFTTAGGMRQSSFVASSSGSDQKTENKNLKQPGSLPSGFISRPASKVTGERGDATSTGRTGDSYTSSIGSKSEQNAKSNTPNISTSQNIPTPNISTPMDQSNIPKKQNNIPTPDKTSGQSQQANIPKPVSRAGEQDIQQSNIPQPLLGGGRRDNQQPSISNPVSGTGGKGNQQSNFSNPLSGAVAIDTQQSNFPNFLSGTGGKDNQESNIPTSLSGGGGVDTQQSNISNSLSGAGMKENQNSNILNPLSGTGKNDDHQTNIPNPVLGAVGQQNSQLSNISNPVSGTGRKDNQQSNIHNLVSGAGGQDNQSIIPYVYGQDNQQSNIPGKQDNQQNMTSSMNRMNIADTNKKAGASSMTQNIAAANSSEGESIPMKNSEQKYINSAEINSEANSTEKPKPKRRKRPRKKHIDEFGRREDGTIDYEELRAEIHRRYLENRNKICVDEMFGGPVKDEDLLPLPYQLEDYVEELTDDDVNRLMEDFGGGPPKKDNLPIMPNVGLKVRPGPDWMWNSNKVALEETGVVTSIDQQDLGWVHVKWDNGVEEDYRYGLDYEFDIEPVDGGMDAVEWPPGKERIIKTPEDLAEEFGLEQLRNRMNEEMVEKYGPADEPEDGEEIPAPVKKKENLLDYDDEELEYDEKTTIGLLKKAQKEREKNPPSGIICHVWQFQDDEGDWRNYPPETRKKLESEYTKRPEGTCIIKFNGVDERVMFSTMEQRNIDHRRKSRRKVRRKELDANTLKELDEMWARRPPPGSIRLPQGGLRLPQGDFQQTPGDFQQTHGGFQQTHGGFRIQPTEGGIRLQPTHSGFQHSQGGFRIQPTEGGFRLSQGGFRPPQQ